MNNRANARRASTRERHLRTMRAILVMWLDFRDAATEGSVERRDWDARILEQLDRLASIEGVTDQPPR